MVSFCHVCHMIWGNPSHSNHHKMLLERGYIGEVNMCLLLMVFMLLMCKVSILYVRDIFNAL